LFICPSDPSLKSNIGRSGYASTSYAANLMVFDPQGPDTLVASMPDGTTNTFVWVERFKNVSPTAGGVTQVLVGETVGATGQVLPATTETYTIALSTSGWLGPWSPSTYNQTPNAPNLTYSGAVNATALVAAAAGCVVVDFTATTTLCVRFYTTNAIFP